MPHTQSSDASGLVALNRIRSRALLGEGNIPAVAIVTSQQKKLKLLRLEDVLTYEGELAGALALTKMWTHRGRQICTFITGVGGPSMDRITVSAFVRGVRVIIRLGSAGLIQPGAKIGQVIVPSEALSDCSVYRYYHRELVRRGLLQAQAAIRPSPQLLAQVRQTVSRLDYDDSAVAFGQIFSTSLIMHEGAEAIRKYMRLRCLAADMETATLLAGAQSAGAEAIALHVGSDHIIEGHHHSDWPNEFTSGVRRIHQILDDLLPYAFSITEPQTVA